MTIVPTVRHSVVLAALVSGLLLAPGRSAAQQTNSFAAMKSQYEAATLDIGAACVFQERAALTQYGKALDVLLKTLKQKGDLDAYRRAETEKQRFLAERTVPDTESSVPALAGAVKAYHKAVADAANSRNRDMATLLNNYVNDLDELSKQLGASSSIEDAKKVASARDEAARELAVLESKPPKGAAPMEAKLFNGHQYLASSGKVTWHEAKRACEKMGGHLVTIADKDENDFVISLVSQLPVSARGFFWMGCSDEAREGDWRWVDGSKVTYNAWYTGEPNNGGSGGNAENCGGSRFAQGQADWNDVPADNADNLGYVCEWDR